MTTSRGLVDDIVRISGLSRPKIRSYVEKLRERELINKKGRGISAAVMKVDDAAALLSTILAQATIPEAPEAARAMLNLPLTKAFVHNPVRSKSKEIDASKISEQKDAWHIKTFGELMRRLIYRAMTFSEHDEPTEWETLFEKTGNNEKIEISCCQIANKRPPYFAFVKLKLSPTRHLCLEYSTIPRNEGVPDEPDSPWISLYNNSGHQIVTTRSIGMPMLRSLALSLSKEPA